MSKAPVARREPTQAVISRDRLADDIQRMPSEDLRSELLRLQRTTAEGLLHIGLIVAELRSRQEDIDDLNVPLLHWCLRIAAGQVLPEIVLRYQGAPMILSRVAALPLPDQQKLVDERSVEIVERNGDHFDRRRLDPLTLGREQVMQVFAADHVRSESEQIAYLGERALRPAKKDRTALRGKVRADRERQALRVGRYSVPVADVLEALADLRGDEDTSERDRQASPVPLTEEEHRRLRLAAAESGASMTDLIRRAMRAGGLI